MAHACVALLAAAAATGVASHHPLWPVAAMLATAAWGVLAFRLPGLWLFVVPAVLPAANLSPWTGWIVFEEFDLVVLAALSAGHARLAIDGSARFTPGRVPATLVAALGVLGAASALRGLAAGHGAAFGWFDGYTDPLNSVRVFKPLLYAVLAWPLVQHAVRSAPHKAIRRFVAGVLAGLAGVALSAAWERAAYPGLLDFGEPYRTAATFWEMHVGGAAFDAYLATTVPFVALALWSIRSRATWIAAALLALVVGYACLTTFSRGVYLAVGLSLLTLLWWRAPDPAAAWLRRHALAIAAAGTAAIGALVALFAWQRWWGVAAGAIAIAAVLHGQVRAGRLPWRTAAAFVLVTALAIEAIAVFGPDSFMRMRLSESRLDSRSRLVHWAHGLSLPAGADWLWGIGMGRLPSAYAAAPGGAEFSGRVTPAGAGSGPDAGSVRLSGPRSRQQLGGLFSLTQRVERRARYVVAFDARADAAANVKLDICDRHLLYDAACQTAFMRLVPQGGQWRRVQFTLGGPPLPAQRWPWRRATVLSLSIVTPGSAVDVDNISLRGEDDTELAFNGDFSRGLAGWLPAARRYFVPWHIDSLYLELLVERGLPALCVAMAMGLGVWRALRRAATRFPQGRFFAASLVGACGLGLVSGWLDVPRVAFLVSLVLAFSFERSRSMEPGQ